MVKKKKLPKFNFTNPEKIETLVSHWEYVINFLIRNPRHQRAFLPDENEITPNGIDFFAIGMDETTQLYTALDNEDGWYSDGVYDSTFIKTDMKPFKFKPRRN